MTDQLFHNHIISTKPTKNAKTPFTIKETVHPVTLTPLPQLFPTDSVNNLNMPSTNNYLLNPPSTVTNHSNKDAKEDPFPEPSNMPEKQDLLTKLVSHTLPMMKTQNFVITIVINSKSLTSVSLEETKKSKEKSIKMVPLLP